MITIKLFFVVKVYLWFIVQGIVYVNELFNFFIVNLVGKPIINKRLVYIFKFVKKDSMEGR